VREGEGEKEWEREGERGRERESVYPSVQTDLYIHIGHSCFILHVCVSYKCVVLLGCGGYLHV